MAGGTDDEAGRAAPAQDTIPAAKGGLTAPILFFDAVPVCGIRHGVVSLVLEAYLQDIEGDALASHRRVVGHLRTTAEGIRSLKAAVEKLELMTAKPAGGTN